VLTDAVMAELTAWQSWALEVEAMYLSVFFDALQVKIGRVPYSANTA
jgi:transposase-like protein